MSARVRCLVSLVGAALEGSRMRRLIAVVGSLAAIVAWMPVTRAAGAWELTPVPGSNAPAVSGLELGFSADGTGLIGWSSDLVLMAGPLASLVGPGGPGVARSLGHLPEGRFASGGVQWVGRRQMALVEQDVTVDGPGAVWLRTGPVGGALGGRRTLARGGEVARVTGGPRGDLAVALRVLRPTQGPGASTLRVIVRRTNGHLLRVHVARDAGLVAMDFNRRGDLLVAYDRTREDSGSTALRHRIEARLLPAAGRLRRTQLLGRGATDVGGTGGATLTASLARDRRALVGWTLMTCGESRSCSPATLRVAMAERGGRFGRGRLLARHAGGSYPNPGPVLVAAADDGRSTVAWNAQIGGDLALLRAETAGRRLGPPVRVSPPGQQAQPAALASGRDGTTALLWTQAPPPIDPFQQTQSRLMATVRSGRGAFGSLESVTDQPVGFGQAVTLAVDPAHKRPAAVWQGPSDASNHAPFLMLARR
jgi:hypothetical protein